MNSFFIVSSLILHLNLYIGANAKISIGSFNEYTRSREPTDHQFYSGTVSIINNREMEIKDLNYDGKGLHAYWSIGIRGLTPTSPGDFGNYRVNPILQDPHAKLYSKQCYNPPKYFRQTVRLTLPAEYTWRDVEWLGIYSYGYKHLYNYINIPRGSALGYLGPSKYYEGNPFTCNHLYEDCDNDEWADCFKCVDGKTCAADFISQGWS